MILKQITIISGFLFFLISYSYTILVPISIFSIDYFKKLALKLGQYLSIEMFKGLNTKFYLNTNKYDIKMDENPELVDIIVANHISSCDYLLIISYLKYFNIDLFNFILKKEFCYYPGIGYIVYVNNHIKISRSWEKDEDAIKKQLDVIKKDNKKKQVIIIFPEGTRFTEDKFKEGQQFSKDNNYPIFNNLLVPRTKGLWLLVNILKEKGILGKIWDMTLIMPKNLGKSHFMKDIISKPIGKVFNYIKEIKLTRKYKNMEKFKLWFFNQWKKKDFIINNYKNIGFEEIIFKTDYFKIIFVILTCLLFIYLLTTYYGLIYSVVSIIIAYLMLFLL